MAPSYAAENMRDFELATDAETVVVAGARRNRACHDGHGGCDVNGWWVC
ncbi:MAG TPA: hypothetical protein VFO16_15510 [Pseudonocardiaceae bacterium]|nr:hypothetical protein [Pseudonocardiaceae bacterium]